MIKKNIFKLYLIETPNFLTLSLNSFILFSLSPILIEVSKSLKVITEDLNIIITFVMIGVIIGELSSSFYNYKIKKLYIMILGHFLILLLILLLVITNNIYLFYIIYLFIGYFIGILWIQALDNLLTSEIKNKGRLAAIALSFYSIGAVISPLLSSIIVKNNISWRFVYLPSTLLIFLTIVLYITLRKSRKYNLNKDITQKYSFKEVFIDKRCNTFFVLTVIISFTFMISQTIISTWGPIFYRTERYFDIYSASLIISIFYITNFIGRIILSFIIGRIKQNVLIIVISSLAFISIIFMIFFKSRNIIFTFLVIGGLSCSGILPILVSTGSTIYDKGRDILVTILFVIEGIGGAIAPVLIKFFIRFGTSMPMILIIVFMGVALIIIIIRSNYNKLA